MNNDKAKKYIKGVVVRQDGQNRCRSGEYTQGASEILEKVLSDQKVQSP